MTEPMHLSRILHCARCGNDHYDQKAEALEQPFQPTDTTPWTHWFACPTNGQPVLVQNASDEAPPDADRLEQKLIQRENEIEEATALLVAIVDAADGKPTSNMDLLTAARRAGEYVAECQRRREELQRDSNRALEDVRERDRLMGVLYRERLMALFDAVSTEAGQSLRYEGFTTATAVAIRDVQHLRSLVPNAGEDKLDAMTTARNEACEIAEGWLTSLVITEHNSEGAVDGDLRRIAELRKVGS